LGANIGTKSAEELKASLPVLNTLSLHCFNFVAIINILLLHHFSEFAPLALMQKV
jgi:hypothetical protein